MKDVHGFINAKCTRPTLKRVRLYTSTVMRHLRKEFKKYLPSPFTMIRGEETFLVRVPVVMTTIPETPEVITIGPDAFIRISESPLSYRAAITRKAVRL